MNGGPLVVVGAGGFLGRHIAAAATARGLDVVPVGRPEQQPVRLRRLLRRGTVVIDAAGRTSGDREQLWDANVVRLRRLADIALEAQAALLTIGSAAEYGDPPGERVRESDPAVPVSDYGASKLAGTQAVGELVAAGLTATVARVFNVVAADRAGRDPASEFAKVVRELPSSGGVVRAWDSSLVRDLMGVDAAAELLLDLAAHVGEVPLVNVCTGRGVRWAELIDAMAAARGVPVTIEDTVPGGIQRVVGDPQLLHRLVGRREPPSLDELARAALGS
ncbi:NAD(P)-dependent oxidoreductase [Angustibacter sp. Root456]|uniref:NAD-dependent epimerase/dehydratase family protein n=1 Tax=Angustibacter sp. Root456 TaxID=1736539 RepID=UPI0006FABBB7|nr:NAD-dependent epimerase/dehydratase family protein [Angustibacter sp. Root456]KQX62882.1 hypothetical protein ASD06_12750 [Angustibacter sp. Root456]